MWEENPQKTDEEIVSMVKRGDIDAFGVLMGRYEEKMLRYGRKFIAGKEDIKDTIQNVFLKAYQNIQGFDTKKKFSSWLYRIAHNELVNVLKKKKRSPVLSLDFDIFLPYLKDGTDIEKEINMQEMKKAIDSCLDKLDPKYREPLVLYYFEEADYKEISDIMRIPVSTVGVRLKRGREIIKKIYQENIKKHE